MAAVLIGVVTIVYVSRHFGLYWSVFILFYGLYADVLNQYSSIGLYHCVSVCILYVFNTNTSYLYVVVCISMYGCSGRKAQVASHRWCWGRLWRRR